MFFVLLFLIAVDGASIIGPTKKGVIGFEKDREKVCAATGSCKPGFSLHAVGLVETYQLVTCKKCNVIRIIELIGPALDHWGNHRDEERHYMWDLFVLVVRWKARNANQSVCQFLGLKCVRLLKLRS